jgi:hypothetical protein
MICHPERSKKRPRMWAFLAESKDPYNFQSHAARQGVLTTNLRLDQKLPIRHNLLLVHPDIKLPPHHINMRR